LATTWAALAGEVRTWTFSQDGQMITSSGGTVSFKRKGRVDAAFVRMETTNVVLLAPHQEYLTISTNNLSDNDRDYLARLSRLSGIDEWEAAGVPQNAMMKNEMSRRKIESAKLNDEAAAKRRSAETELEAADKLDAQAAGLASMAGSLQFQAQTNQVRAGGLNNSLAPSPLVTDTAVKVESAASISNGAADQLEQDIAKLRSQAQEKRLKAANLQREAANLEQTAAAEVKVMAHPPTQ
jgi:hypothetical protein